MSDPQLTNIKLKVAEEMANVLANLCDTSGNWNQFGAAAQAALAAWEKAK